MKKWSDSEIEFLKNEYPKNGAGPCSQKLQRTYAAIANKAKELRLKYTGPNKKLNPILTREFLQEEYINKKRNLSDIAIEAKCTKGAVWRRLKQLKFEIRGQSEEQIKKINGRRFGRLIVNRFLYIKKTNAYWECKCDCGNTTKVATFRLLSGVTQSCGCYGREKVVESHYKGGKYLSSTEFSSYVRGAKVRNLEFNISIKDIEDLYEKQNKLCKLSGIPIVFNSRQIDKKIIRGNASVDRIDSSKGYTIDNIQLVDKDVNIAKQDKSDENFIDMCCKVADYQRNK